MKDELTIEEMLTVADFNVQTFSGSIKVYTRKDYGCVLFLFGSCFALFCLYALFLVRCIVALLVSESKRFNGSQTEGLELLSQSAAQLLAPLIATFSSCRISPAGNTSLFLALVSVCVK